MNRKIYIIHGSAIVQYGLAHILSKNFKCIVKCFSDLKSYTEADIFLSPKTLIFVEYEIANSEEYLQLIEETIDVKSFSIVNFNKETNKDKSQFTLYLYDSPDEIYEQVKQVFKQQEFIEDESEGLSNREVDVLKLVALGYANKEIAEKLFISTHTVMSHRKNMTEKLGIKSISGLTVYAIINNYIDTTNLKTKDLI